ncbi:MAG: hypothetical protein EOM24_37735, partial [Chloroflexia bacterium]|nr:hypothetical protein [Chloroflexia bacterium]
LVLGGGGLLAAFPLAYAILMPALYLPVILMLLGLIFRGVSFEYRHRAERSKPWWDRVFFVGSALAAFSQGMILGALVQGAKVNGEGFELIWLTPFTLLIGLSVVAGYALLGSTYLIIKTRLPLAQQAARLGKGLLLIVLGALIMVSLLMVFANEPVFARWFNTYHLLWLAPLPILSALLAARLYYQLNHLQQLKQPSQPFWLAVGLFITGFAGLLIRAIPIESQVNSQPTGDNIMNIDLQQARERLAQGEVIAYPTEAVFGLGCDPFNQAAVNRLLTLKQRPVEKGLILVAAHADALAALTHLYQQAWSDKVLASWQAPTQAITWLLPKTPACPEWI